MITLQFLSASKLPHNRHQDNLVGLNCGSVFKNIRFQFQFMGGAFNHNFETVPHQLLFIQNVLGLHLIDDELFADGEIDVIKVLRDFIDYLCQKIKTLFEGTRMSVFWHFIFLS